VRALDEQTVGIDELVLVRLGIEEHVPGMRVAMSQNRICRVPGIPAVRIKAAFRPDRAVSFDFLQGSHPRRVTEPPEGANVRPCQPGAKLSGQLQATRSNPRTTLPRFGLMPRRAKAAALEHQLPFPQTMMVSRLDELTVAGNRWFESTSLQCRVHCEPDSLAYAGMPWRSSRWPRSRCRGRCSPTSCC
jgi:hypothetical protein